MHLFPRQEQILKQCKHCGKPVSNTKTVPTNVENLNAVILMGALTLFDFRKYGNPQKPLRNGRPASLIVNLFIIELMCCVNVSQRVLMRSTPTLKYHMSVILLILPSQFSYFLKISELICVH